MCVYGYARVSTKDQNLNRQYDALLKFPVEEKNIFADKESGKNFNRSNYLLLMEEICSDDVLVIKSIDRLGRNYNEILDEWRKITKEIGAAIVVLDMPLLDTREVNQNITGIFIADMVLQLLSYVAQVERENIKHRQAEGIASAKRRGVKFGRPSLKKPQNYQEIIDSYFAGSVTKKESAEMLGVSLSTFDRWLKRDEQRYLGNF